MGVGAAPSWSVGWLGAVRAVHGQPALRRLEVAWAGSTAGDAIATVAFAIIAYRAAGAGGVAALVAVQMLPSAALAPLVVAWTSRWRRERLALAVDAFRIATAAAAALLAAITGAHAALLALAAVLTTANAVSNVARRAMLPLLVAEAAELTAAGVVASVIQAAAQTAGPAAAAVLLALSRTSVVLIAAAACFAIAAVAESGMPSTAELAVRPLTGSRLLRSLAGGVHAVRRDAQLSLATALFAAKNVGRGAMTVLLVIVPLALLGLGRPAVGWLTALVGAGGVVGGAAAARLVGRRRLVPPMALGLALWGLPLVVLAGWSVLAVAVVGFAITGVGNTITDVAGYSLIGRSVRDDLLASVYGVHEAVRAVAYTAGAGLTAAMAGLAGVRAALVTAGALLVCVAGAGLLARGREWTVEPEPDDLLALQSNTLVGWLPPLALARIAATVQTVDLRQGDVLLREGDPGDRAYVVAAGEVEVKHAGREVARLGVGGVVGEIALLRDVPRTATVSALTDCRLLALEREEFLVAVGGSDSARVATSALVDRRLAELEDLERT